MSKIRCSNLLIVMLLILLLVVPTRYAAGQSPDPAQVGIFTEFSIAPDARVEIPIEIRNADGLYGLDIQLKFDPAVLAAEDADPSMPGVQMALGNFLDPGLLLYNTVDNEKGTARFVMAQYSPSEPKNGNGILLVLYFKGLAQGESQLAFTNVQLSTRDGIAIPSTNVESVVRVAVDSPVVEATSIPVQAPTLMIVIPTAGPEFTPTPLPTSTPEPTPTISSEKGISPDSPDPEVELPQTGEADQTFFGRVMQFFLANIWWIMAVMMVLVVAAALILLKVSKEK